MRRPRQGEKGSVLILVTLSAGVLFGLLGLTIDLGWMYFVKRSAQTAADAAAQAAAVEALVRVGQSGAFECSENSMCQSTTECPAGRTVEPVGNLDFGCEYAARNGFQQDGKQGTQTVSLAAGDGPQPPTAPGVSVDYWVTAIVTERVPASFSAVLGRVAGLPAARATAAVVEARVNGSLILLNREDDCLPMEGGSQLTCGVNLLVQANNNGGTYALEADGGILLASTANGNRFAGENRGGGTVRAPFTYIRGGGGYFLQGSSEWLATPVSGKSDGPMFLDPMRGKGQPPAPRNLMDRPVPGGLLEGGTADNPLVLSPGSYYAADSTSTYATGEPIRMTGHIRFTDGGDGFGEYVFFGGVANHNAGTSVTLAPGIYVFAGVRPYTSGDPRPLFDIQRNMTLQDATPGYGAAADAGELLVFTDTNYPGLQIPQAVQSIAGTLQHGESGFAAGATDNSLINLHGLNDTSLAFPDEYRPFAPVVMWQDQANSVVKYSSSGHLDTSCGDPGGCPNLGLRSAKSPRLRFNASPNAHFYGVVYQPRGAWTEMSGGGAYAGPLQLIAGAVTVQGNSRLNLAEVGNPIRRRVVALVE